RIRRISYPVTGPGRQIKAPFWRCRRFDHRKDRTDIGSWLTVGRAGEHNLRRPLRHVEAEGLILMRREWFKLGIIERLAARKP
ncbi:MAG: hypothetical protein J2P28_12115, partial [Actinobacteria bacterium]|nr:hypothetical protein [Actinomycetota bacterium]